MASRPAEVAILVPVLRRPHRVTPLIDSIRGGTRRARIVLLPDPDDRAEREAIKADGRADQVVPLRGNYAQKINCGVRLTDEPYVFLGADDLDFHPGWFEAAYSQMSERVGVVGTNDLGSPRVMRGEHSTHCLVARWYAELGAIDEPDKLLHEGYLHEYVDDELVGTAKHRGAWTFAEDSHVEHLHPAWGKAEPDALYRQQKRRMRKSRHHYLRRQELWT